MTRTHGRCLRGQRLLEPVPHGHWKTSTLVAGLCLTGITAPYVMDGAMTGDVFLQYIKQILAPTLTAGDIVVMDNVATHKVAGIREAIEARGATLLLGGIEDVDQTFVNGRPIGNTSEPGAARQYRLPAGTLRAGDNHVVVNVLDTYGTGGMTGPANIVGLSFDDGTFVPLGGDWLYRAASTLMGHPPRTPWESTGGMTTIGNAMIAPQTSTLKSAGSTKTPR